MNLLQNNNDLRRLARSINARWKSICESGESIKAQIRKAAPDMIFVGTELIAAKARVEHGLWLNWLATNCPLLPIRTAQSYITLARKAQAANDGEIFRLLTFEERAALPETADEKSEPKRWTPEVQWFIGFSRLETLVKDNPVATWPEPQKARAREKLDPWFRALHPEKF